MLSRHPIPDHIAEVTRYQIEHGSAESIVVNESEERNARAYARPGYAYAVIALTCEPVNSRASIHDSLAHRLKRATQIGAHHVIGALKLRRHSSVVIGKAQAERGNSEAIEQTTERNVAVRLAVPLRQHEHGAAMGARGYVRLIAFASRRGKIASIDCVVFTIRRLYAAGECEMVAIARKVDRAIHSKEAVAFSHSTFVELEEDFPRV
jgi:hypothetical protein